MDTILHLTFLYLMLLLLALLVERIMEILHAAFNYAEWQLHFDRKWNRRANRLIRRLESKAKSKILTHGLILSDLGRTVKQYTRPDSGSAAGNVIVISGNAVRQVLVSTLSRIVASAIGFGLCLASGINIFTVVEVALNSSVDSIPFFAAIQSDTLQMAITGVLIGLGSEPVHSMIGNLESRREKKAERDRLNKALLEATKKSS